MITDLGAVLQMDPAIGNTVPPDPEPTPNPEPDPDPGLLPDPGPGPLGGLGAVAAGRA